MTAEDFREYNFPEQNYQDLVSVAAAIEKEGLDIQLGINHIGGRISP